MNARESRKARDAGRLSSRIAALRPGAHVVTPRAGYSHHGIYIGGGLVVHYRGLERGLRFGPVETVSIEQFARGRPLRVLVETEPHFDDSEIVQRAMSRIGEDRYHVLINNCEHFCEWCVRAEQRSDQVDRLLHWLSTPLRVVHGVRDRATQICGLLASHLPVLPSNRGRNP